MRLAVIAVLSGTSSSQHRVSAASSAEQTRFARGIALAALVAAIVNFIAFYPGILHHDAWAYFRAVRANDWTNWQPPLLGFLWIPLQKIYYGPQPMLVLFVAAYWAGFALLAIAFAERDRRLAFWTFVSAFFPLLINFNGQLVKDVSMAVCLLLAVAFAAGIEFGWIRRKRLAIPAIWLFFVSGAFMRANSLFGLPPLFELAAGASSWRWVSLPVVRRAVIACLIAIAVAPGHLIADRYIFRVLDVQPMSQLQIFDLGGITFNSGSDAFQGFFGPNFVQRNRELLHAKALGHLRLGTQRGRLSGGLRKPEAAFRRRTRQALAPGHCRSSDRVRSASHRALQPLPPVRLHELQGDGVHRRAIDEPKGIHLRADVSTSRSMLPRHG